MHVFGTETQLSEFNPVDSLTSRRFYLHMQEQHQLELFQHQVRFHFTCVHCFSDYKLVQRRILAALSYYSDQNLACYTIGAGQAFHQSLI